MSRTLILLIGLVLFALLCWWSIEHHGQQIQENIRLATQQALRDAGYQEVNASADGRDVTLTGRTIDATARVLAESMVMELDGVRTVNNEIAVGEGSEPVVSDAVVDAADPESELAPEVAVAEESLPEPEAQTAEETAPEPLPQPQPQLQPETVAQAQPEPVAEPAPEAEPVPAEAIAQAPQPAEPVPYRFKVAARSDGIHLGGMVSSDAERDWLAQQAKLAFPEQTIHNRLELGAVAFPAANSLAPRGLGMLTDLISGTLDVDARGLRINGGVSEQAKRDVLEQKLEAAKREHGELQLVSNIVIAGKLDNQICQAELNRLIASEKILFENEKAGVNSQSYSLLDSLANVATRCDARIEIGGHTDSYGDDAYNQWLSEQRAKSVMAYLTSNGVSASRLSVVGYGETQPIDENNTRAQRANNRRIEFRVLEEQ
ncbi:MAG: OmpA family protein [Pseudomonadota bacterium]